MPLKTRAWNFSWFSLISCWFAFAEILCCQRMEVLIYSSPKYCGGKKSSRSRKILHCVCLLIVFETPKVHDMTLNRSKLVVVSKSRTNCHLSVSIALLWKIVQLRMWKLSLKLWVKGRPLVRSQHSISCLLLFLY